MKHNYTILYINTLVVQKINTKDKQYKKKKNKE